MREYNKTKIGGSPVDIEFRKIMNIEVGEVWKNGKIKNKEKVNRLVKKYLPNYVNGNIRDIMVDDDKLDELNNNVEKNVKMYGGVELNEEEKAALEIFPQYRVYKPIDKVDLEVEIEKGCVKVRNHFMDDNNNVENAAHENVNENDRKDK